MNDCSAKVEWPSLTLHKSWSKVSQTGSSKFEIHEGDNLTRLKQYIRYLKFLYEKMVLIHLIRYHFFFT